MQSSDASALRPPPPPLPPPPPERGPGPGPFVPQGPSYTPVATRVARHICQGGLRVHNRTEHNRTDTRKIIAEKFYRLKQVSDFPKVSFVCHFNLNHGISLLAHLFISVSHFSIFFLRATICTSTPNDKNHAFACGLKESNVGGF